MSQFERVGICLFVCNHIVFSHLVAMTKREYVVERHFKEDDFDL
jgi:hypothetical protein